MKNVILIVLVSACLFNPPSDRNKIQVVVTLLPQAEFVEKIGKDAVEVSVMVPPGASPHTYEPTPSQLAAVSRAQIYVKMGSGVEFELAWMDKILKMNKDMIVVDCSEGIELMQAEYEEEHEPSGVDPHTWLSPRNAVIMVETIYKGLIQIDPSREDYYTENKEAYVRELEELDREIQEILSKGRTKKIMVYHPSWSYFCRDYGLEQIPISKEGKEPTPQGITALIEEAKKNGITIIFASPQFNTESAEVIAREIGGKVVLLDPLERNYLENMRKVAEAFAEV